MIWIFAYTDSLGAAQTDTDMPVVSADATLTVDGATHPLLPIPLYLIWAYYLSPTGTRARIQTPKFRPIARPLIRPIEAAANPSSRPQLAEFWRNPIKFNAVEPIQIIRTYTAAGERCVAGLCVGDGNRNAAQGDNYTVRCTTSFTPSTFAWSLSGAVTFDDSLLAGQYMIVGMDTGVTGGIFSRLAFPGPPVAGMIPQIRPGVITPTNLTSQGTRYFRFGYMGNFGAFESFAPPQLDVFMSAATANQEFYMDLVLSRQGARAA